MADIGSIMAGCFTSVIGFYANFFLERRRHRYVISETLRKDVSEKLLLCIAWSENVEYHTFTTTAELWTEDLLPALEVQNAINFLWPHLGDKFRTEMMKAIEIISVVKNPERDDITENQRRELEELRYLLKAMCLFLRYVNSVNTLRYSNLYEKWEEYWEIARETITGENQG
jgi:hypothetical protein